MNKKRKKNILSIQFAFFCCFRQYIRLTAFIIIIRRERKIRKKQTKKNKKNCTQKNILAKYATYLFFSLSFSFFRACLHIWNWMYENYCVNNHCRCRCCVYVYANNKNKTEKMCACIDIWCIDRHGGSLTGRRISQILLFFKRGQLHRNLSTNIKSNAFFTFCPLFFSFSHSLLHV